MLLALEVLADVQISAGRRCFCRGRLQGDRLQGERTERVHRSRANEVERLESRMWCLARML